VVSEASFCNSDYHMQSDDLKVIDGAAAGAWIKPRLIGEFGAVTREVPNGFEAYARIFHPAFDQQSNQVRWAEVAKACGTTPHREMQWHAILGLADPDELRGSYAPNDLSGAQWTGSDPPTGAMDIETLDVLCEILAVHTTDPTGCFFGLCTIQSWLDSFSADEVPPLLNLPYDRDHIVLTGPLTAVDQIVYDWSSALRMTFVAKGGNDPQPEQEPSELLQRGAPNLIWPADHSWFVASDVDFASTLIGGSVTLIEAIVRSPELEAWQVGPGTSLAADADKINAEKEN
jgi:hypothetical protein